jgi:hypothetical protein
LIYERLLRVESRRLQTPPCETVWSDWPMGGDDRDIAAHVRKELLTLVTNNINEPGVQPK